MGKGLRFCCDGIEEINKRAAKLDRVCREMAKIFKENELCVRDVIDVLGMCRADIDEAYLKTPYWLSRIVSDKTR